MQILKKIIEFSKRKKIFRNNGMLDYFMGIKIYGNDFSPKQIQEWFTKEENAYFDLYKNTFNTPDYIYHDINYYNAYSKISKKRYSKVLMFGGADGSEILPILSLVDEITIIDSSDHFFNELNPAIKRSGISVHFIKANKTGKFENESDFYDLITCFGVLHHVPNVSFVLNEFKRVLKQDGVLIIREPIISLGDWTKPRRNLTSCERGIPFRILLMISNTLDLKIEACNFARLALFHNLSSKISTFQALYKTSVGISFDRIISNLMIKIKQIYHPISLLDLVWSKTLNPTDIFLILRK